MKHIDEFTIHSFRGIRDLKLEKLGQINLLVGDNNSGKTSVLEALALFCDPLNFRVWFDVVNMREMSNGLIGSSLPKQLLWFFRQEDGRDYEKKEILLSARGDFSRERVSARYEEFAEIDTLSAKYVLEAPAGNEIRLPGELEGIRIYVTTSLRDGNNSLSPHTTEDLSAFFEIRDGRDNAVKRYTSTSLPMQLISSSSHLLREIPLIGWTNTVATDMKDDIIELLKLFDPRIEDVDILTPGPRQTYVSLKHMELGHAPLNTFGDGLRRVFTLATSILSARNGLLLIDELETAVHTSMLQKTFDWLIKSCIQNNVQLFATTHSLEAVDAVIDACSKGEVDLVAYRLQKKGQTGVTRLNKKLLTRLRENLGLEVR